MKSSDKISRNPLNIGDMRSFLLKMAAYRSECKATSAYRVREAESARRLLMHINDMRMENWWDGVTDVLVNEDYGTAQNKLHGKYGKEQIIDMFQQTVQVLYSYFILRECYDATRLMEYYESEDSDNEKSI